MTPRPRVLVIYKKSTLQRYRVGRRGGRIDQLLEQGDAEVQRIVQAHEDHRAAMVRTRAVLRGLGARATFRTRWREGDVQGYELVLTLGGDGTLLFGSHAVPPGIPVVAINSAPRSSVGYFTAGTPEQLEEIVQAALSGQLRATELTRMQVEVDGKVVSTRILNDVLFCHECPAVTSRYRLRYGQEEEEQRSSGIWVGPAAGSTAALRSAGGEVLPLDSQALQFVIRELYRGSVAGQPRPQIDRGLIEPGQTFHVRSMMRDGRLFLDGAHRVHLVPFGSEIRVRQGTEPLTLLGLHESVRDRA